MMNEQLNKEVNDALVRKTQDLGRK